MDSTLQGIFFAFSAALCQHVEQRGEMKVEKLVNWQRAETESGSVGPDKA